MPFSCSICEQESTRICAFCTKDACSIHICDRCGCCSDCCQCDVPLDEPLPARIAIPPEPVRHLQPPVNHAPFVEAEEPESEPQPEISDEPPAEPFETPER
ncbi:MAG: hypothetical protein JWO48_2361 [Bryobacterales bacterium]|nr:hypothetical protein [Bryobacterales bacterium]